MTCLFLVAGYATRMGECPKALLKVQNKTILDWLLEDLRKVKEINRYVLITNHKYYDLFQEWANKQKENIEIIDNGTCCNAERLGAVRDIQYAIDTANIDDDLFVTVGDYLINYSFTHFFDFAHEMKTSCIMYSYEASIDCLKHSGVCEIVNERLVNLEEKPVEPKTHWCALPYYYYVKEDVHKIKEAIVQGCATDAPGSLVNWMCANSEMHCMEMPGICFDVGNIFDYQKTAMTYVGVTL